MPIIRIVELVTKAMIEGAGMTSPERTGQSGAHSCPDGNGDESRAGAGKAARWSDAWALLYTN